MAGNLIRVAAVSAYEFEAIDTYVEEEQMLYLTNAPSELK